MTVHLVGAGPGDPGLVTVRGAQLLAIADVVVFDRLTAAELLEMAPPGCEMVNVGKDPSGSSVSQDRINELLVAHGRAGRCVVRLKGGDPFVFARGAEEAAALEAAGVDYEVVPGITSAFAAPAYAGIPVTLRYSSTHVTVVTGHEDLSKGRTDVDWEAIASGGGTIVILMGVGRWQSIRQRLLSGGLDPLTPAAAVQWGTTPRQRTVRATLSTLEQADMAPPATIVVGNVAGEELDWFERRPLFGRSVVVTRAKAQAGGLADLLSRRGADVIVAPTIEVVDADDGGASLRAAIDGIATANWVVVTSPNGAERLADSLRDARDLAGVSVAAIGPGTASALAEHRLVADLVPGRHVAESLLEEFPDPPAGGGRVVILRAQEGRDVLPDGLAERGWTVELVPAYRTVPAVPADSLRERIEAADAVLFASSSAVRNWVAAMGGTCPPVVGAIGPITAQTASDAGMPVGVQPEQSTLDDFVDALCAHFAAQGGTG
ncbi:MAG: uroporphyrinogen-III C-methyltransferase [Actinomycetia bacterium]|nr:uroporphyrinogen-III C-methyltransferase [Actinomycetes bacterium]